MKKIEKTLFDFSAVSAGSKNIEISRYESRDGRIVILEFNGIGNSGESIRDFVLFNLLRWNHVPRKNSGIF